MNDTLTRRRRGFSLIEVLLAVFILGIGVLSIAALFPVGIAQQRQSVDDVMGGVVADSALAIIRAKARPEHFGTLEMFGINSQTVPGDWPWGRPAFFRIPETLPGDIFVPAGSISIFGNGTDDETTSEVPWNTSWYPGGPGVGAQAPAVIISQFERYYPMYPLSLAADKDRPPFKPQYVWDCMFRRFQGKIFVAIFVYRVNISGGGNAVYHVPPNPDPANEDVSPLPIHLDLSDPANIQFPANGMWNAWGVDNMFNNFDDAIVLGTEGDTPYDPDDHRQAWQEPGQWILDQNNNVHRVLSNFRQNPDDDVQVELVRPIPILPDLPVFYITNLTSQPGLRGIENVVTNIWYIPTYMRIDTNGDGEPDRDATLTPVYVTVREL